ncbi:MAG: endonuclease/exonuclease/phosphatase family protein [Nitrospiria bacterium]
MKHEGIDERTAKEIEALRKRIKAAKIPSRKTDENLLVATWNIRNFGKGKPMRAIHYIAEICDRFDVIAIQEVKDSLLGLERLQRLLGPYWKVIFSDPAGRKGGGNDERLAFLYDKRRVVPTGLASEIVLDWGPNDPSRLQFARTPYCVSFRAGTFDFVLVTVHIRYAKKHPLAGRTREIAYLARWLKSRFQDADVFDPDVIVLGDFNIEMIGDQNFKTLVKEGFYIPPEIQKLRTNLGRDRHYDQIAYFRDQTDAEYAGQAGTVDFVGAVYQELNQKAMSYKVSDHLPLWAEFDIDLGDYNLDQILNAFRRNG